MITVEKIGGTSMTKFQSVLQNIIIGNRKKNDYYSRIFVVSAYCDVTNMLLEHKKTNTPGVFTLFANKKNYNKKLDEVLAKLISINKGFKSIGLDINEADEFITKRIQQAKFYLKNMAVTLSSGYVNKNNIL